MKYICLIFMLFFVVSCGKTSYPLDGFSEPQKILVKAIKAGDVALVRELAVKTDLDLVSDKSVPLLTAAIYEALDDLKSDRPTRRLQVITELVRAGAPLDKRGDFIETPISMALMQTHPALLKAMLEGGLDPNFQLKNNHDVYIIFEVLNNDKLESVKLLVKYGADINAQNDATAGETPAHDAVVTAPKVSYYLVSIGADIYNKNKFTGETFAMSVFNMEKSLQESIARIKSGKTQGYLPVIKGNLDAVQKIKAIMIEKGIQWPPVK